MTSFAKRFESPELGQQEAPSDAATAGRQSASSSPKMLTDFSIDSIMSSRHRGLGDLPSSISCPSKRPRNEPFSAVPPKPEPLAFDSCHVRTTTKFRPKNYQCPACKMAFSNNGQLKNHVRIHTGERPFRCNFANCNKTFTRNEELTRHKLIHTGVRPHSCSACGKKFGRKDHLKKHTRTHERKRLKRKCHSAYLAKVSAAASASASCLQPRLLDPAGQQIHSAQSKARNRPLEPTTTTTTTTSTTAATTNNTFSLFDTQLSKQPTSATGRLAPLINAPPNFHTPCIASHQGRYPLFLDDQSSPPPPAIMPAPISAASFAPTRDCNLMMMATGNQFMQQQHRPHLVPSSQSPVASIQQLASEYWTKWYNLLGFYQQRQYPSPQLPTTNSAFARLGSLIKRP